MQGAIPYLIFHIMELIWIPYLKLFESLMRELSKVFVFHKVNQSNVCVRYVFSSHNILNFSADRANDLVVLPELKNALLAERVSALFKNFWDTFFFIKFSETNFAFHY